MDNKNKWYQTNFGTITLLVLFFPVGLFLMWKYSKWSPKVKWGVSGLFLLLIVFAGSGNKSSESVTSSPSPSPVAETKESKPEISPTSSPSPAKPFEIIVTSQIVKKVDKKYRYFFDIRNNDTEPFEGDVTIKLYKDDSKSPLGSDVFSTKAPIEPDLGTSVFIATNTGPKSVHGEYGLTKFTYQVSIGGNIVKEGSGDIIDKLEDLDALGF